MSKTTPSQSMIEQSERVSFYEAPVTAQQIADAFVDSLVSSAQREGKVEHYGVRDIRGMRFTLAGGGPGTDITFLVENGDVDYAVLDYHEGGPRAQRVLTGSDADTLLRALLEGGC